MGRRGFQATSPLSAALTLTTWMETEGRWPMTKECQPSNGLHHAGFYYKIFTVSCFSHALRKAIDLASGLTMMSAIPLHDTTVHAQLPRQKRCLGDCGRMIVDEGAHVRFCRECSQERNRQQREEGPQYFVDTMLSRSTLKRLGVQQGGWEDMIYWVNTSP